MSILFVIDLILVSLWALFALCNPVSGCILVFPVILIRLSTVFCLQLRERKSWIPILAFMAVAFSTLGLSHYDYNDFVLRPFARMYDYIIMLITGHSTLLEGAYHYLGNHGDLVPFPGEGWRIFVYSYIVWLVFAPIPIYTYLWARKKLKSSSWNWKRICYIIIAYTVLSAIILCVNEYDCTILPGAMRAWWLAMLLIPLIVGIRWHNLSLWCRRYIEIASIFFIAIIAGIYMQSMGSLIAIMISVPMFYYFVGYRWTDKGTARLHRNMYLLLLSGGIFWTAQYAIDLSRIVLLFASVGLVGYVAYQLLLNTKKLTESITLFIVGGFILPSIALGYNQFNCIGAKRLYNYTDYGYSYRGLLKVRSLNGFGIRDRFGYITPIEYEQIETMGNSSKPFVKFKHGGFWGVYDLERQSVVVKPEYNEIRPYDKNSWRLMDEFSVRYGCHDFFVTPGYYYRYRKCGKTSDCPFIHGLEDELPLKYDCDVKGAIYLDYILTEMMTILWQKPDSVSHADFYWHWAENVSSTIDRLHEDYDMFYTYDGLYNDAMDELVEYIDPSEACGFRAEMNAGSYLLATIENYRMVKAVQELADSLPNVNIRREYELFNEFMSAFEEWREIYDERNGRYGDLTLVQNCNAAKRFKDRRASVEEMTRVLKWDSGIMPETRTLSVDKAFDKLASECYKAKDLVPKVKLTFTKWIDYRNQIASEMPQQVGQSYRYQTRKLEKFYTSDEFLYEDEL